MPGDRRLEDEALGDALTAFARRVAGDGVSVSYRDGVAEVRGAVASATRARALADLIGGHDGVARVVSAVRIIAGEAPAEHVHEVT